MRSFWKSPGLAVFIVLNVLGFWGFLAFFFFSGTHESYPKVGDEVGVLLSAATLVLTVLTVLLAIFAVIGYAEIRNTALRFVDDKTREVVPAMVDEAIKKAVSTMLEARLSAVVGGIYVQLYDVINKELDPREMLDVAIRQNRNAMKKLDKDDPKRIQVLNNLAYSYALRKRGKRDGSEAIKYAEELARLTREENEPAYEETWTRIMIEFHDQLENREERLKEVRDLLGETARTGTPKYRNLAERSLARLREVAPNLPD
jgi:hypothetical protein